MAQLHCPKCGRTKADTNFYTYPNGSKCELCKDCLTLHLDAWQEDSFLWILEKFDVPYIKHEWANLRDKKYKECLDKVKIAGSKNPNEDAYALFKHGVIFGKYLAKMKLSQYKEYKWADTDRLQVEFEEKNKLNIENQKRFEENIQGQYERGEISESQYMTYHIVEAPVVENFEPPAGGVVPQQATAAVDPYFPINDNPFEKVDLPDVGAELTQEDKIMLAVKWGRQYTLADWVTLEQLYNDYDKSFDLHNADLISGIKRVCKLDLKCNQALDSGDYDSYSKLERASDSLRKSLKLTEAQRKEEKNSNLSCIGQIVSYCEMKTGYIPKIDLSVDRDIVDRDIRDIKNYTKTLIQEDPSVYKQIEEYIKKREILAEQEADASNPEFELTDEDLANYNNSVTEQIEEDSNYEEENEE